MGQQPQQMKRDPCKPDYDGHTCPWCGGTGVKQITTTKKVICEHCLGKCKVSPEKAATYQDSFVAKRREYLREDPKLRRMSIQERVRLEIESGWNPKDKSIKRG